MRRRYRVFAVAGILTIAACTEKPAEQAEAAAPVAPVAPQEITVHARDFAFDAPDTIPAGLTTIRLINDGPGLHHGQLLRIDSSKTFADAVAAIPQQVNFPSWLVAVGGPNAVAAGDTSTVTQDLAPGNYMLICLIDVPSGSPHYKKGMEHAITVVPSSAAVATPPAADINVTLRSYAFELSAPITAGRHTFKVITADTSSQSHELVLIQLAPGKTGADILGWLQKPEGPPPGRPIGGVADLTRSMPVYFSANLTPGNYLLICFDPDFGDGKPHFMHGMMETVSVS
jgi:hypothetical protein